jgi:hypothetical protein
MTIEEYLKKSAEEIENTLSEEDIYGGNIYLEGKRDAYREILEKLPELDHEVTVREVMEMCGDCSNCPYPTSPINPHDCWFDDVPSNWPVYDIRRRMKEVRK